MKNTPSERIYGIVGGLLISRAVSALGPLVAMSYAPVGAPGIHQPAAFAQFLGAIIAAAACVPYLKGRAPRWLHWLILIAASLGILLHLGGCTTTVLFRHASALPVPFILLSTVLNLAILVLVAVLIVVLLQREKEPNQTAHPTTL
jgi:hypothetical protein